MTLSDLSPTLAPRRMVVATDWTHGAVVLATLRAYAAVWHDQAPLELVLAVPHEPGEADLACVEVLMSEVGASVGPVSVESFRECGDKPFELAVVPQGDADLILLELSELISCMAVIAASGSRPDTGQGEGRLEERLTNYAEPAVLQPSTPAPAPTDAAQRTGLHGTYIGDDEVLVAMTWGARILCSARDRSRTPILLQTGSFESNFVTYLRGTINPGDTVVDIGANIGLHTVLFGYLVGASGRVISYEPFPTNLRFLRDNVEINWLMDVVEVRETAVSNTCGTAQMNVSDEWDGLGSLLGQSVQISGDYSARRSRRIDVTTERLDEAANLPQVIDLIKIDVEGAENRVFEGMERLLEEGRVTRVAFECMREHMRDEWTPFAERLARLANAGWGFSVLLPDGTPRQIPVEAVIASGDFRVVIIERPGLWEPTTARRIDE